MNKDLFDFIMGMLMVYSISGAVISYGIGGLFDLKSGFTIIKYITILALIMLTYLLLVLTSVTSSMVVLLAILIVILLSAGQKYINNDDILETLSEKTHIPYLDKIIYGLILILGLFIAFTANVSDNNNTYNFGPLIDMS